jgi:CrcB protein
MPGSPPPLRDVLLVFLGGGIGAWLRFSCASLLPKPATAGFPLAILLVNVAGCGVLGVLIGHVARTAQPAPNLMAFAGIGICGGFTTFSTFAIDAIELMREGRAAAAFCYVLASVLLGIGAAAAGIWAARV